MFVHVTPRTLSQATNGKVGTLGKVLLPTNTALPAFAVWGQ